MGLLTLRDAAPSPPNAKGKYTYTVEKQHRALVSKLDRGYDDYVEGRISEGLLDPENRRSGTTSGGRSSRRSPA